MRIEFDPKKDALNLNNHKVSLALTERFDWDTAQIEEDKRFDYDEQRMRGLGFIGDTLFYVAFVEREGVTRVFHLRPATKQEFKKYVRYLAKR